MSILLQNGVGCKSISPLLSMGKVLLERAGSSEKRGPTAAGPGSETTQHPNGRVEISNWTSIIFQVLSSTSCDLIYNIQINYTVYHTGRTN